MNDRIDLEQLRDAYLILKLLRAEESKLLKQLDNAQQQLDTVRTAIKLLSGNSTGNGRSRRKMSAATDAKDVLL